MADAVVQLSETTYLRYKFTVDGVPSAVPTVTAVETAPDGTISNLSNPTLQNSGTSPSYVLAYSNASAGVYTVEFLTDDTSCDQYPGVVFYVAVGQVWIEHIDADISAAGGGASAADIADAVWDEALSGHVSGGTTGEALGLIDDVKAKTDNLGVYQVFYWSLVNAQGNEISVRYGDAYNADNANGAIPLTAIIPGIDLTTALEGSIQFSVRERDANNGSTPLFTVEQTAFTDITATTAKVALTSEQTKKVRGGGNYICDAQAAFAGAEDKVTWFFAKFTVEKDVTP